MAQDWKAEFLHHKEITCTSSTGFPLSGLLVFTNGAKQPQVKLKDDEFVTTTEFEV